MGGHIRDRFSFGALACLAVMGCSKQAAQPAADCDACDAAVGDTGPLGSLASASFHLVAVDGASCQPSPRWVNLPIGDVATPTLTGSMRGHPVFDGENGAAVYCSVFLIGGGYAMSAELDVPDGRRYVHLTTSALINPKSTAPQPISIDLEDESTGRLRQGDCTLVPGIDGEDWSVAMAPGRFWGKIACSSLLYGSSDAGASGCAIDVGYLELGDCR
jgi:hypothetical protein